jgi:hypothetical protein
MSSHLHLQRTELKQRALASVADPSLMAFSSIRGARPNPVFNRTPCGSPRLAFISFWAKRGLPQGAG